MVSFVYKYSWVGVEGECQSVCLACLTPWVWSPASHIQKNILHTTLWSNAIILLKNWFISTGHQIKWQGNNLSISIWSASDRGITINNTKHKHNLVNKVETGRLKLSDSIYSCSPVTCCLTSYLPACAAISPQIYPLRWGQFLQFVSQAFWKEPWVIV